MKKSISLSAIEKILKDEGADRVSHETFVEMREVLEDYGKKIAHKEQLGIAYPNRSKLRGITAMQIDE